LHSPSKERYGNPGFPDVPHDVDLYTTLTARRCSATIFLEPV